MFIVELARFPPATRPLWLAEWLADADAPQHAGGGPFIVYPTFIVFDSIMVGGFGLSRFQGPSCKGRVSI